MMFFMRDLHGAYDGTVRNAYGNQLVQFSYNIDDMDPSGSVDEINNSDGIAGRPVGPLAACAISEAAYSALDQPISLLEKSPLLNLKVLSLSLSLSLSSLWKLHFIMLCKLQRSLANDSKHIYQFSYKGHLQMTVDTSISLISVHVVHYHVLLTKNLSFWELEGVI
jgi:hypothetical protein